MFCEVKCDPELGVEFQISRSTPTKISNNTICRVPLVGNRESQLASTSPSSRAHQATEWRFTKRKTRGRCRLPEHRAQARVRYANSIPTTTQSALAKIRSGTEPANNNSPTVELPYPYNHTHSIFTMCATALTPQFAFVFFSASRDRSSRRAGACNTKLSAKPRL